MKHGRALSASQYLLDYEDVLSRISAQERLEQDGVKEFWLFAYYRDDLMVWESNMSSPTTGDISNSDRYPGDLPIYSKTYVVYGYNYHRTQAEAVHNHGHQLEAMFSHINRLRDGNTNLFWGQYVGMSDGAAPAGQPMDLGRCGWTHSPPNTAGNYDYGNDTEVQSDCEDWRPDGNGLRRLVNASYWANIAYDWPVTSNIPQKGETQFYLWWSQNLPGASNQIPAGNGRTMSNWWEFIADWDAAVSSGGGLTQ
jgi:hypothetical protein